MLDTLQDNVALQPDLWRAQERAWRDELRRMTSHAAMPLPGLSQHARLDRLRAMLVVAAEALAAEGFDAQVIGDLAEGAAVGHDSGGLPHSVC